MPARTCRPGYRRARAGRGRSGRAGVRLGRLGARAAGGGVRRRGDRGQRAYPGLGVVAARLAREAQRGQARDLLLAEPARRMVGVQRGDQPRDAVAQLQREVRRGGAHELADVVDGDVAREAVGMLGLAHGEGVLEGWEARSLTGTISRSASIWDWTGTEKACSSPMIQP